MGTAARAKLFLEQFTATEAPPSIYRTVAGNIRDVSASPGRCTAVLPVTDSLANLVGNLSGGAIATLVDIMTTTAAQSTSTRAGLSVSIDVKYLAMVPVGGEVRVEGRVVKAGRTLTVLAADVMDAATGKLVAQGTHIMLSVAEWDWAKFEAHGPAGMLRSKL